jgi:hypothetical protein
VRQVCDRVAVLEAGRVVESGTVAKLFLNPAGDQTATGSVRSRRAIPAARYPEFDGKVMRLMLQGDALSAPVLTRVARETGVDLSILDGRIGMLKGRPVRATDPRHRRRRRRRRGCRAVALRRGRGMSELFANIDWSEIAQACLDTVAMLAGSLVLTILLGLPLGVLLFLTGPGQVWAHRTAHGVLAVLVNLLRSVPFIILLIVMIPVTVCSSAPRSACSARSRLWSSARRRSSRGWSRPRCAKSIATRSRRSRRWARRRAISSCARCCPRRCPGSSPPRR